MGGGGIIIIRRLAETPGLTLEDCRKLMDIEQRSPAGCSLADAYRVLRILWKYLRP